MVSFHRTGQHPHDRVLTYALLTADGVLSIVTTSIRQLHALIDPEQGERGRDPLPVIPGLALYFGALDYREDLRPLNRVANQLVRVLDPEFGGYGDYRGSVALVGTSAGGLGSLVDLTAEQRERLLAYHRDVLASVRGR